MLIYGNGITTPIEFRTNDFKVRTQLDMEYFQTENGNWYAVDRGYQADYYECDISTYGTETYINDLITNLNENRLIDGILQLSDFAADEHIFGEDLNYTLVYATVIDWEAREQNSWKGFNFKLKLRALSPTFSSTALLPNFSGAYVQIGYKGDKTWNINKYDTYFSDFYIHDHSSDAGLFVGSFNFTNTEIGQLRRWRAVNRDTAITISGLFGVNYMFGPKSGLAPWTVKILDIEEKEKFGIDRQIVEIKFGEFYE